jgi:hypothetical protein
MDRQRASSARKRLDLGLLQREVAKRIGVTSAGDTLPLRSTTERLQWFFKTLGQTDA